MSQTSATIERPASSTQAILEDQLRLWTADAARADSFDDDEILDSWLASLEPAEFERFLNSLAVTRSAELAALDPTA